ncbi:MAG TPA: patatin-like phospholipase family protein [Acidimicrobiia bacterium]|jgi:NTE family protein
MSSIGLVLGGGGITGAAFQLATLMSLELACDWRANDSEIVVGTSGGAYVASLVRSGKLDLDSLVRHDEDTESVAERIRRHVFQKNPALELGRWLRGGVLPGLRKPGVGLLMGSPARYTPHGLAAWVEEQVGPAAHAWPNDPTVITAYDVEARERVGFGTESAPAVSLAHAVAASSAIPLLFHPHQIEGRAYVDGGVASGTHLDLVLESPRKLDLVIVIAPMAATERRRRAFPHELVLDRLGRRALEEEMRLVTDAWPDADILVLRPPMSVLDHMRPNPMAADRAVPTFVSTLRAMRRELASPEVWRLLHDHFGQPKALAG